MEAGAVGRLKGLGADVPGDQPFAEQGRGDRPESDIAPGHVRVWKPFEQQGEEDRDRCEGDSAGAGLTLALLQTLRDAGEALPGCAWLVSPPGPI